MRVLPLVVMVLAQGCSSFSEVGDSGAPGDGESRDGKTRDGKTREASPHPDLGGKRAAGDCCAKDGDCVSGDCDALGSGPGYCTRSCTTQPDSCPVGFGCDPKLQLCVPPVASYNCGPEAGTAGPQPTGGCCGKKEDCVSGECLAVGQGGQYFCSQTCTPSPDTCPTGYVCSTSGLCGTPGTSTCSFK